MERLIISLCFLCLALASMANSFEFASDVNSWDDEDELMPTIGQVQHVLDTREDVYFNWDIDSHMIGGFVQYADSVLNINSTILNLTNPNEFNAEAFGNSKGIWYSAHNVQFENSADPWVIYATFNFTRPQSIHMKFIQIRYYLHGETALKVYRLNAASENITNSNEVQQWEEILINLDELELDPDNNHSEYKFRLEFHTAVKNQDFFLLDRIIVYDGDLPYTGPTTTTVKETTMTDASTTTPQWTETPPTSTTYSKSQPTTTDESDLEDGSSTTIGSAATKYTNAEFVILIFQSLFIFFVYHVLN